jgi:protein-L-isoaspartate(D-aspartate) O-methyltransferase
LTAAAKKVPKVLLDQMADDGIIVAPIGTTTHDQNVVKFRHLPTGEWESEDLWPVRFVPMLDGKIGDTANQ